MIDDKIREKFDELISSGNELKHSTEEGEAFHAEHRFNCVAWLTSTQNIVHLVVLDANNPYRISVDRICNSEKGYFIPESVGEAAEILKRLLSDIDAGLIASIEDQTRAVVFDDFLDHAKWYLKEKRQNESGVIAGVVFEDICRSICRNVGIEEKGAKLDHLISELVKNGTFSGIKAKRARVAAGVRTSATPARWEEFELEDVKTTIEFTEEIIQKHLEN